MFRYSNVVECPKSADFPAFIKDLAWGLNLKMDVEVEESGFIFKRQTVRFRVWDESKEKLEQFVSTVFKSIEAYQQQVCRTPSLSGYGVPVSGYGTRHISGYGL